MQSFLDPAILFFVFGLLAGLVKSNLEIPPPISRFLSLYLLMALGLKGGFALAESGFNSSVATSLACAVLLAILIPVIGYQVLRRFLSGFDAAAIAATYGSVSAVTFITTTQFLESHQIAYGGHMAAAMALMESPAIVIAVLLANRVRHSLSAQSSSLVPDQPPRITGSQVSLGKLLHESVTDGAQMLLMGALVIGMLTGESGKAVMHVFSVDLFKGMLAFFLLDMGLLAARNIGALKNSSIGLLIYAVVAPVLHAGVALLLSILCGLHPGDASLLMLLAASASYIAVPAALRIAIPEANPSLYIGLSLGVTFPLNILVGIPLYSHIAQRVLT
ncbi:sodium-dependent bicarbonate transport family permease [Undibacterium sp. Rencai35W]|uniref:sodium-dependent bicarbonate transport family permease n=1 Tax=Undibacterium sp. Rencai35W TaxID=3413046 RepID=UPI003BF0AC62